MKPYSSIPDDGYNLSGFHPTSGFLGGNLRGGQIVQRLEELWAEKFKVKHAIACNSATSGLLAAAYVSGLNPRSTFATTPFTMSATSAAPMFTGAKPFFIDISPDDYCPLPVDMSEYKAAVITNIFGHPARLRDWRAECDKHDRILIEDNAQAILAMEDGVYAGTIGHIGVFSLNVHKHIQVGEGGIIVTNNASLASDMRLFINHGELAGRPIGLNLRMTEYTAYMAIQQLKIVEEMVEGRIKQAEKLINLMSEFKWIELPKTRPGCKHVYYVVPFTSDYREEINFPGFVKGYVKPLNRMFNDQWMPRAESLHDSKMFYFSNCEWTMDESDYSQLYNCLRKVEGSI